MLHSHLYGQAKGICKDVPFEKIESNDCAVRSSKVLYKRDVLSDVSEVHIDFLQLLPTKRSYNETCRDDESIFVAAELKLTYHGLDTFHESFRALINANRRISVLATATANNFAQMALKSDQKLVQSLKYDPIDSILRLCDKGKTKPDRILAKNSRFRKNEKLIPE